MSTIVLIPGGYHGGWYFTPIMNDLRRAGHEAYALTLSGLGGPADRHWAPINLETHIEDVVSFIEAERLYDVVLCGHSYGGLVIAAAADRLRGRVRSLLFIDALVPNDGESVWSTWDPAQREAFVRNSPDGIVTNPPPGVDERARPHPLACFMQPCRLSSGDYGVKTKVFVWCGGWNDGPFRRVHDRVVARDNWIVHRVPFGHDVMNGGAEVIRDIVLATAEGKPERWDIEPFTPN